MLNFQEVCYQYWPSQDTRIFGDYTVALLNEEKLEGFVVRTINITHSVVSWGMKDKLCHCCDITMLSIIYS